MARTAGVELVRGALNLIRSPCLGSRSSVRVALAVVQPCDQQALDRRQNPELIAVILSATFTSGRKCPFGKALSSI
eukprot:6325151-Amphidinium_carterae.1